VSKSALDVKPDLDPQDDPFAGRNMHPV